MTTALHPAGPQGSALRRALAAEAVKLTRPRVVAASAGAVATLAVAGTALTVSLATPATGPRREIGQALPTQALSLPGGGTAIANQTLAYASVFLFAIFIAAVAGEFTRGTFRTMLLQLPRRGSLLFGRLTALVGFTLAAFAVGSALTWVTARAIAPGQGIDSDQWTSWAALRAGGEGVGRAAVFLTITAVLAAMIGVLARSVPLGVGVGLVWAGPIENLIGGAWAPGQRYFPMLLLRSVLAPGSTSTSTTEALVTLGIYSVVAAVITAVVLRRRDVTS